MKKVLLSALLFVTVATISHAQTTTDAPANPKVEKAEKRMKHRMDEMSPEDRAKAQEHIQQMKDKWNNMTPEEKEAAKEKFQDRKEKVKAMPPEERKALRSKIKEKRAARKQD